VILARKGRFASITSLAIVALALASCGDGGGGVNSLPTPAPSPTPSPSPTPTPTSTPNDDLISPLTSENFKNSASVGTISVSNATGGAVASGTATTLRVSYDAASQSYALTDGSFSQTFSKVDIDPSQSNTKVTTYKVASGKTTDFLTLSNAGTAAGQTRYVGAGFWQRETDGSASTDGRFDAFTYGVQTAAANMPRTGTASYAVQLLGASTLGTSINALAGSGRLDADFASGAIAAQVGYSETDLTTGSTNYGGVLSASAMIASGTNGFSGHLSFNITPEPPTTEIHGAFYGPDASEVGASFSGTGDNSAIVGALWGGKGDYPLNQYSNLTSPENATFFDPIDVAIKGTIDTSGKVSAPGTDEAIKAIYFFNGQRIVYRTPDRIDGTFSSGANFDPSYSVLAFGNQYLVGGLEWDGRSATGVADAFLYGENTTAMPRTGTASFDVDLGGIVMPNGAAMQSFEGDGSLQADFASGKISTMGAYRTHAFSDADMDGQGAATTGTGDWTGSAALSSNDSSFAGTLSLTGALTYSGTLTGGFYGPNADEVGGVVHASQNDGSQLIGTLVGRPGADVSGSQLGLLNLQTTTTLQGTEADYDYSSQISPPDSVYTYGPIAVVYDPKAKSYTISGTGVPSVDILAADRAASESGASFDVYHGANYDAQVFRPGAGNPQIALTYTSFAKVTMTEQGLGSGQTANRYVVFGGETPGYAMPTSGTATYDGVVYGQGSYGRQSSDAALSGSSALMADFAKGTLTLNMNLTATDRASGTAYALGNFAFGGTIGCQGCDRSSFLFQANGPAGNDYSGFGNGQFDGPHADEFGATFTLNIDPNTGQAVDISRFAGVTVGKKR
jgi:hypothetical protein